ncbi:PIN domain-containing protein [Actinotalea sp. JY-7876]|uniref:PIN domain-containing protein n=1 Tax=Actinotalea sp. JY-7876 TaxID=2758442 RepID=UPI0015F6E393|nr:PIN domain-containing protein [Actinotalea sp. JY-7876]
MIYADGSALSRALAPGVEAASWLRFAAEYESEILTSPLGLTELRRAAALDGPVARAHAHRIAESVRVVRFSDKALAHAAEMPAVLSPFQALHLGIAVAHRDIDAIATYDALLARVAATYAVHVVTPGRPATWWQP